MEVKEILENQAAELLDIELDCLEEEVETGDYNPAYRKDCKALIRRIKKAREIASVHHGEGEGDGSSSDGFSAGTLADLQSLSPFNNVPAPKKTDSETVAHDLAVIRKKIDRKTQFRAYLKASPIIDEAFCDEHFDLFAHDEMSILLETRHFSESFLQKYFTSLDGSKIARYQLFSEDFFIEHFNELDPSIVLRSGRNEWRSPDRMSSKLNVFLRLKGVQL